MKNLDRIEDTIYYFLGCISVRNAPSLTTLFASFLKQLLDVRSSVDNISACSQ